MLFARFSARTNELLFEGSPQSLLSFSRALVAGDVTRWALTPHDPAPYGQALAVIELRPGDGLLRLMVEDRAFIVCGDDAAREYFAETVAFFATDSSPEVRGTHLHVEWYPEHGYIAEDSTPLVISFRDHSS